MKVWVVYVPYDYNGSDIVGVYDNEKRAEEERRNKQSELSFYVTVRVATAILEG